MRDVATAVPARATCMIPAPGAAVFGPGARCILGSPLRLVCGARAYDPAPYGAVAKYR